MSMLQAKAKPKANQNYAKNRIEKRGRGSAIVASATISKDDSAVTANDIYNEPIRGTSFANAQGFVPFLDSRSAFCKQLLALVNNSPTLRRIIVDKSNMIKGDGFIVYEGIVNPMLAFLSKIKKTLGIESKKVLAINDGLLNVNRNNETLQDVIYKGVFDYNSLGNCFFELVKIQTSEGEKVFIYHIPTYMVAFKKMESDMLLKSVGIKESWEDEIQSVREVSLFPKFTQILESDNTTTERTIIAVKNYAAGYSYWGLPSWIASKNYAEMEYRIGKFHISELKNSFIPSAIAQFFGNVTQDEAQQVIDNFKKSYTDTDNHNKVFAQVLRDEKLKANIQILDGKREGSFLDLMNQAAQMIVTASNWTMSLAGFTTSGSLGTNQQIRSELEIVQNTIIKPIQNTFIQNVIQPFLNLKAESDKNFDNISLSFSNSTPISFLGEIDINKILTTDELREIAGYQQQQKEKI